jgi:hypothetical protein
MQTINFADYPYYPTMRCDPSEHIGYRWLHNDDKMMVLPIFELCHYGKRPSIEKSIDQITTSVGERLFILDLCHDPAPPPYVSSNPKDEQADAKRYAEEKEAQSAYSDFLGEMLNPSDGYIAWRNFVSVFPNAIPVIQHTDTDVTGLQSLRQASMLSKNGRKIAIRLKLTDEKAASNKVIQILSILDSPEQLLIIVDCGQGRLSLKRRIEFARTVIGEIVDGVDTKMRAGIRAVCVSGSYPDPDHQGVKVFNNEDWNIWKEASEIFPFQFGDYSAMNRKIKKSTYMPNKFVPVVSYPTNEAWTIYRHDVLSDYSGWSAGSKVIVKHETFEPAPDTEGVRLINLAAKDSADDAQSSRFWIAAKVNMHIHRQIYYAASMLSGSENDDHGDDE